MILDVPILKHFRVAYLYLSYIAHGIMVTHSILDSLDGKGWVPRYLYEHFQDFIQKNVTYQYS